MKLKTADTAPGFELLDQDKKLHKLPDYNGKWVLLYFYPKDFTPGCTTEARKIRDRYTQFVDAGISVLGVSGDTIETHKRFQNFHELPFSLLADPEKKVIDRYGARGVKKLAGREFEGTLRISFLIDPEGRIAKIYENVKPAEHAAQILEDQRSLSKAA